MAKKIFIFSFVVACVIQGFIFTKLGMADLGAWAKQAEYFETNNPKQFDILASYGHPGGPIIEGVIFIHNTFNFSYEDSLMIFIIILDGLIIAGASVISYLLSKNNLWWPIVLVTLSVNWLYVYSTPPSTIVSLLISLLFLFSIYIYQKEKIKTSFLVFWELLAGLMIATRLDIGAIMFIAFLIFLKSKISWRQTLWVFIVTGVSFILFDPFMWFMPIQHMGDLLFKIIYHYEYFHRPEKLGLYYVFSISALLLVSMFFSVIFLFIKEKIKSPIPFKFIYILLTITIGLYIVFLTAQYQASRYLLPLLSIWQIILPLFIFSLTANLKPTFSKIANTFFTIILILSPLSFIISSVLIDKIYN